MFVQIVGKGYINVNSIVMVSSKNSDGKYMVTLSHGGKIIVTQKVRDEIVNGQNTNVGLIGSGPRVSGPRVSGPSPVELSMPKIEIRTDIDPDKTDELAAQIIERLSEVESDE